MSTADAIHLQRLADIARALLMAYAKGEVRGGSMDWEDLDGVFEAAKEAMPGDYERALAYARESEEIVERLISEPLGDPPTYRIVRRYRQPPESEVIHEGYTLEQAQAHCQDSRTTGVDWMDTYEKE